MPPDRGLARLLERRLAPALAVLALLPLAWVAVHVGRHAVQVPVHDQWNVQVPIAIRAAAGTLAARDLLAPYLEHRYLLTRAWTAVNARLFGWDLRLDALVNVLIALGSLLALLALLRRQQADAGAVAAVLFSALLLSPRQRWTWGLLSSFGGIVLLLALALGTLTRGAPSWRRLLTAGGLATLATWSGGPGVAVWPALAVAGWLAGYRRRGHAAAWLAAGGAAVASYLVGYARPPMAVAGAADLARYAVALLGAGFVPEAAGALPLAAGVGALGLALAVAGTWVLKREGGDLVAAAPWVGLCVFSVAAAVLAAVARAHFLGERPWQPLRARYVTLSAPFWVGVAAIVLLAVAAAHPPARRRVLGRAAAVLLIALAPLYLVASLAAARAPIVPTREHERCLRAFPLTRDADCLAGAVFGLRAIQPRIDELARHRLGPFRQ